MAVDQDIGTISQNHLPTVTARAMNLEGEDWPLDGERFSGIVVTNYLYRPYLDRLPEMLEEGGVLIYETFAQGMAQRVSRKLKSVPMYA